MDSKKVRKILIVCIVINLIVLFAIISVINKKDKNQKAEISKSQANTQNIETEVFKSKTVLYKNYKGGLAKADIIERINLVVDQYFPILKKELEGKNVEEYYKSRTAAIKKRFGITKYEDFKKLAEQVRKINCPLDKYISSEIKEDSFKVKDNYTVATLVYTYENKQTIELDFYMINDVSNDQDIKYVMLPR